MVDRWCFHCKLQPHTAVGIIANEREQKDAAMKAVKELQDPGLSGQEVMGGCAS